MRLNTGVKIPCVACLAAALAVALPLQAADQRVGNHLDEIIQLAKKEPKVRLAVSWQGPIIKTVTQGYGRKYPPLSFEMRYVGALPSRERMLNEAMAGLVEADLVNLSAELRAQFIKAGVLIGPIEWAKLFPDSDRFHFSPDGYLVATGFSRYGIIYNPKLVPPARVPKTWDDCLDAGWKGKMLVYTRPRTFTALYSGWGKDKSLAYAARLKANDPVWVSDQPTGISQVAAGEYPMGCGFPYHSLLNLLRKDPTADVKFVVPTELPFHIGESFAVMKGAKSPNASILLAGYLTTPEVQDSYELYGRSSPFSKGSAAWKLLQETGARPIFGGWAFEGEGEAKAAGEIVQVWGFPKGRSAR